jgi:hypothetical protein
MQVLWLAITNTIGQLRLSREKVDSFASTDSTCFRRHSANLADVSQSPTCSNRLLPSALTQLKRWGTGSVPNSIYCLLNRYIRLLTGICPLDTVGAPRFPIARKNRFFHHGRTSNGRRYKQPFTLFPDDLDSIRWCAIDCAGSFGGTHTSAGSSADLR